MNMQTLNRLLMSCAVTLIAACSNSSDDFVAPPAGAAPAAVAPTITQQPADATVTVGQPASFAVTATGTDPLAYQWQRNGVDVAGANAASYTTAAAVIGDSGATFRALVSNIAGSTASNSASLTVNAGGVPGGGAGYFKASNTFTGDEFGTAVAISSDGNTMAVAAVGEDGGAPGINGNQADNSASSSGAVYIFARIGGVWSQQAYVKASNTGPGDQFGWSLALSSDGNTLAVSSAGEGSAATGIDGNQADNSSAAAGAVYVFTRSAGTWSQQAYVKASNTDAGDQFGSHVALSPDGNTLAVGAIAEDSNATGINGDQANNAGTNSGAVYVFTRSGAVWTQQAYIKASNPDFSDNFGFAVALGAGGDTLAVSAPAEDSNATGINGDQANNQAGTSGAVYVFVRAGTTWSQQAYVKASNTGASDFFGGGGSVVAGMISRGIALSADGNTLVVGAAAEDSNATGINGDGTNNAAGNSGAAYVFVRAGTVWSQQAYVKASNTEAGDNFGLTVAVSGDGSTLIVGAPFEDSNAKGLNGNQSDNSLSANGAVYVFKRSGTAWTQSVYAKPSNAGVALNTFTFGEAVGTSGDGSMLVIGASGEDGNATGVNGTVTGLSTRSGAVYMY
jgi:hypothetical protein